MISDFSVFHRIKKPLRLGFPRFLALAEQLVHYGGAVTAMAALHTARQLEAEGAGPASASPPPAVPPPVVDVDGATMARMSDHPDFVRIEYAGGG